MGWNYLSIPKPQRLHRWSIGMDKLFYPIFCKKWSYLSMLGLKLIHISKRGPGRDKWWLEEAVTWWRHQMETFSALLALCEGNPPVTGGFPSQRPVTRSFDLFFDLRLNKTVEQTIETPLIRDAISPNNASLEWPRSTLSITNQCWGLDWHGSFS